MEDREGQARAVLRVEYKARQSIGHDKAEDMAEQ
jgi:hypothetical protein